MTARSDPDADLSPAWARRLLSLTVVAAAAVYAYPVWWGLPATGLTWAFDEIVYQDVVWRWPELYPPAHGHVLVTLFAALDPLERWGLLGSTVLENQTAKMLAARMLTILMACLTLIVLYRGARQVLARRASLLAVVSFAFGTNLVFYAKTVNLDVPYVFWFALSLLFFLRCLRRRRWLDYLLFAACGSLAIATKTQAYALYLLAPLALVYDIWRAQPHGSRSIWRALFDRRLLQALGVAVAVQLVVFGEIWSSGQLRVHLAALTSLPYEHYDSWASTAELVRQTLTLLSFNLGVPIMVASLTGVALALSRPRHNAQLLATLLFAVSYYPLFILATGFNYDRHYLPIALVLAVFSGKALAALVVSDRRIRAVAVVVVALVAGHALLRGLSIDLMLAGDARYEAERWLDEVSARDQAVGLGSRQLLPRTLAAHIPVIRFAKWRRGEHSHNPKVWNNCLMLNEIAAEFLIPDDPSQLGGPGINYREHKRFSNRAPWSLVDFGAVPLVNSNVAKVAKDVVVFRRTPEECVDSGVVPRALHDLRSRHDPERRSRLARRLLDSAAFGALSMQNSAMYAVRVDDDYWTAGTAPAGVVFQNPWPEPVVPVLRLAIAHQEADFPIEVFVDEGDRVQSVLFEAPKEWRPELLPVEPDEVRLFIIWADRGWRGVAGNLLGVQVRAESPRRTAASLERLGRLWDQLDRLRSGSRDKPRDDFIAALANSEVHGAIAIEDGAVVVGTHLDALTYGDRPTGILVRNTRRHSVRARLLASCYDSTQTSVLTLSIDDGETRSKRQLDCGRQSIPLGRLGPRQERLFIIDLEVPPQAPGDSEPLKGFFVQGVRLKPKGRRAAQSADSSSRSRPAESAPRIRKADRRAKKKSRSP